MGACLLILASLACALVAAPAGPWLGLPQAGVQGDAGDSTITWASFPATHLAVSRTLAEWAEVAVSISRASLFDPALHLVLTQATFPLVVGAAIHTDSIDFLASLHLGPVRIDAGRSWGETPWRRVTLRFSAKAYLSMVVGLEERKQGTSLLAGIQLRRGLAGVSLLVGRSGWRIECAVVLR